MVDLWSPRVEAPAPIVAPPPRNEVATPTATQMATLDTAKERYDTFMTKPASKSEVRRAKGMKIVDENGESGWVLHVHACFGPLIGFLSKSQEDKDKGHWSAHPDKLEQWSLRTARVRDKVFVHPGKGKTFRGINTFPENGAEDRWWIHAIAELNDEERKKGQKVIHYVFTELEVVTHDPLD